MIRARSAADHALADLLQVARRGDRTLIMGVLNVTPDSFSDGGRFFDPSAAIAHGRRLAKDGADVIDIGGESTRPGARPLSAEAEMARILPVIEELARELPPVSVDTYKAEVARAAVEAGAAMVNDVSGLLFDPQMAGTTAELGVPVCIAHTRGTAEDMHHLPAYADVANEVRDELASRMGAALAAGVRAEQIVLDPGFGFAKSAEHNLELLRRLGELTSLGCPLLVGASRKSTIGKVLGGLGPDDRLEGTAALVALTIAFGASIVRVHDVAQMARVVRMADAVVRGNWREGT